MCAVEPNRIKGDLSALGPNANPFHPNCRCTTVPYFDGDEDDVRFIRLADRKGEYVPSDMRFGEWKREYVTERAEKPETLNSLETNGEKSLDFSGGSGIIKAGSNKGAEQKMISVTEKQFAAGNRRSPFYQLTDAEIYIIKSEITAIEADVDDFVFNSSIVRGTCFLPSDGKIHIKGNIFPDEYSDHPRDRLTIRAVLAHEYYGHRPYRNQYLVEDSLTDSDSLERIFANAWADEFRASYMAAKNAPNLSQEERAMLILDALSRAEEAGVAIKYNDFIRRVLYG